MTQHFAIFAWDSPDSETIRATHRDAHFIHIERVMSRIAIAGPMAGATGTASGSLFVVMAESRDEARKLFESDPYFIAGVWQRWEIHPFLAAAGEWIGGKTW